MTLLRAPTHVFAIVGRYATTGGDDLEQVWALEGYFRPILRMYQPRPEALNGTYVLPPVHRVE